MNVSTIYVGEPVISRYGLTGNKTQDWWISFKNRVYQVPYTVEPRYNDMPREQWNYIVISRYRYNETPDITILS